MRNLSRRGFLGLGCAAVARPQTTELDGPIVLRSTTRLVQVNVVVQDKNRRPIAGLKEADFTISEAGKSQKIAVFAEEHSSRTAVRKRLPPNVFSNKFGERQGVPSSVTVILVDMLNTRWSDQAFAQKQIIRFLQQIRSEDRLALYTLGSRLRVLHDYTTDSGALVARLRQWNGESLSALESSNPDPELLRQLEASGLSTSLEIDSAQMVAANRITDTLRSLKAIAQHLAAIPGRKSLIWVSGSFPLMIGFDDMRSPFMGGRRGFEIEQRSYFGEVDETMRALSHANVAVYPVDARGLMAAAGGADARGRQSLQAFAGSDTETMSIIASRTGGKAYFNRNDIGGAVREVFEDGELTYTIGYYTDRDDGNGKWRDIRVKVNRPDVTVRHRRGYFAFAEKNTDDTLAIQESLRQAVRSPLDASAIGIHARVERLAGSYRITLQIEPSMVTLKQSGDRWTGKLDIAIVTKGAEGQHLDALTEAIGMNLQRATYEHAVKAGILYETVRPIKPGTASFRIVARDAPTGLCGSLTVPAGQVGVALP